jgi:hypothetical protein
LAASLLLVRPTPRCRAASGELRGNSRRLSPLHHDGSAGLARTSMAGRTRLFPPIVNVS